MYESSQPLGYLYYIMGEKTNFLEKNEKQDTFVGNECD